MNSNVFRISLICFTTFMSLAGAQATTKEDYARDQFSRLPGPAMTLSRYQDGNLILGASVLQKDEAHDGFCRATSAVVPNAKVSYACYSAILDGDEAKEVFENANVSETQVLFSVNGQMRVGSAWAEKDVKTPDFQFPLICVKTSAVVPHPVPAYSCFKEDVPVGGGASIGN